jgi:hypothetical protein
MRTVVLRFARGVVRAWTRLYTLGAIRTERQNRLAEIESDLWESQRDRDSRVDPAVQILMRLLRGIPDDLAWRVENAPTSRMGFRRLAAISGVGLLAAVFGTAVRLIVILMPDQLPTPPPIGQFEIVLEIPRRSPPPPPPPRSSSRIRQRFRSNSSDALPDPAMEFNAVLERLRKEFEQRLQLER